MNTISEKNSRFVKINKYDSLSELNSIEIYIVDCDLLTEIKTYLNEGRINHESSCGKFISDEKDKHREDDLMELLIKKFGEKIKPSLEISVNLF